MDTTLPEQETVQLDENAFFESVGRRDAEASQTWIDDASTDDVIHAVSSLPDDDRTALFEMLSAETAGELLRHIPESQALEALASIDAAVAAGILQELSSDERADFVKALDAEDAEAILTNIEAPVAEDIRHLASYEEGTAGALMLTEFLVYTDAETISDVLADLERNADAYADFNIQYLYVTSAEGRLRGVVPVRRLLLAHRRAALSAVMIENPVFTRATATTDDVRYLFDDHGFLGLPVVDDQDRLVGVIERADVTQHEIEEADDLYRQTQGIVGGEELRTMPLLQRSRRRLAWLSANIVLNIIAASMIALHQDTLEAVIAIAVFLPIISDMSGCSGNQAVAVSMRELTLGVTRPRDGLRVLLKEVALGLINGITLGILIGAVAFFWKGNIYLGLVVGAALAMNTIIAVAIGGLVPLLLKHFKTDPALASGPILTTITDMCGFFIVLTLASQLLDKLTGM